MTAHTITVLTKHDLDTLTLVCQNDRCGTRVTVAPSAKLIEACPACGTHWDKAAQDAQVAFQHLSEALAKSAAAIEFNIRGAHA